MKLLGFMLLVLLTEYTFGANSAPVNQGGDIMKFGLVNYEIFPTDLGRVDLSQPNLKADDMLKTISALDSKYDYSIYKSFNEQFIVIALLKGEKDTILDMQYMTINSIKSWYDDKMDEFLNKEREEI